MPPKNEDLHGNVPDTSAVVLLLIDVINDLEFEGGETLLNFAFPAAERIAELKRRTAQLGIPAIYVNDNFGKWQSDFRKLVAHCLNDGVRGEPLARLLAQEVSVQVVARQGEDRVVALVLLGGEDINAWMVKQGHACTLRAASPDASYCAWEDAARSLRRGLWSAPVWVAPWDWRAARKDALFFPTDHSNASTASCMREIRDAPTLDD